MRRRVEGEWREIPQPILYEPFRRDHGGVIRAIALFGQDQFQSRLDAGALQPFSEISVGDDAAAM